MTPCSHRRDVLDGVMFSETMHYRSGYQGGGGGGGGGPGVVPIWTR